MSEPTQALTTFIAPYPIAVQDTYLKIRALILTTTPNAYELIWDNYNAVAVAYSTSEQLKDAYCHFAVYSKHVNLGFNRGIDLVDKKKILQGKGKLIRHVTIHDAASLDTNYLQNLIMDARLISEERNTKYVADEVIFKSVVKSISAKKRRPI